MNKRQIKFLLLGLGILGSMGLLLAVGIGQSGGLSYYLTVDEYLNERPQGLDNYRVNGKVETGTIVRLESGLDVKFNVTDGEAAFPVSYHGIVPDTFVDGADVVVEGDMDGSGVFIAHTMLAKCPSKYEAADGTGEEGQATYQDHLDATEDTEDKK
jgi:cytochrome c-type biogenesis protein CcmE